MCICSVYIFNIYKFTIMRIIKNNFINVHIYLLILLIVYIYIYIYTRNYNLICDEISNFEN